MEMGKSGRWAWVSLTAAVLVLLVAAPAQADPLTPNTLFLLVAEGEDGTFERFDNGNGISSTVGIINIGPFIGAFPFLGVTTPESYDALASLLPIPEPDGREFMFLGGFTQLIFFGEGFFADNHVLKGVADGEDPGTIDGETQDDIVDGLANFGNTYSDLATPGGTVSGVHYYSGTNNGSTGILNALGITGDPTSVFDGTYSLINPTTLGGSEFIFAFDPMISSEGSFDVGQGGVLENVSVNPIPEPTSLVLVVASLLAFGLVRRRRRAA
ncbi:MAG: PEP-CTERM sorting domain-containing protein [Planctomycetota bacterium]|jgi:hypothetical protein